MGADRLLQPFLGYTVARLRVQHGNTEPASVKRVVFRLRCLFSPDQILHMLSSKFAFTCMIHGSPTLRLSSAFFAISAGLFSSVSCCDPPHAPTLWYILMPTGQAVRIRASPPRAMRYFLVTISSPGPPSVRLLYQDPVLKLSIAQWLTG
jgi:hypothetical protein